jgi:methanogenic corrinoid protein MtbC1
MSNPPDELEQRLLDALGAFRAPEPTEIDRWRRALTLALCAGDIEQAHRTLEAACQRIHAVVVLDEILAPAMHGIGALWERNEITIADEHLATAVSHRLLATISPALRVASAKSRGQTVLFATPPPEQHTMGLMMAHDVLHGAGYNTVLLGSGMPDAALSAALIRHAPEIVALSSTMQNAETFARTATMVHERLPATQIITGGAAAPMLPREIPAHHVEKLDGLAATVENMLA